MRPIIDPNRPAFHFLPARNWMNDPNGLIQWRGQYHMFYQYNPNGPFHATMHWGHAVSDDLLHWRELPIALAPTPGGPDAAGCWSGCAVDNQGVPTLIYTGVHPQVVCLATSGDDTLSWQKHPANPVIAAPPAELSGGGQGEFRDPFVWRENGQWQMVIGSKDAGRGGLVLRYTSDDLVHWDYRGVLLAGDRTQTAPVATGDMWECPNFLALDGAHVLLLSVYAEPAGPHACLYYTGDFSGGRFMPGAPRRLVYGASFYAPQVMRLEDGRALMWGWLKEGRPQAEADAAGWSGVMSLPIALSLRPGGALRLAPAAEVQALRRQHWEFETITLGAGERYVLAGVRGPGLELEAVIENAAEAEFGLALRGSEQGEARMRLVIDGARGCLRLKPGLDEAPVTWDSAGRLRLRVFVDGSVVEVFANEETCLVSRFYAARDEGESVEVFCARGAVRVSQLEAWRLDGS